MNDFPHYHGARLVVDDELERGHLVFCLDNGSRSNHRVFLPEGERLTISHMAALEGQSHHRAPYAKITSIIMSREDFLAFTEGE